MRLRIALTTALALLTLVAGASADPATNGIAPPGPTYLRALAASQALGDPARTLLGDRWGDSWFIPNPGRWEIGLVGDGPFDDVRALVDGSGYADVVDLVPVPYSRQQEEDALNQLNALVAPLIEQAKVQTGLGLNDAGLPSVVLLYANNATDLDRRTITEAIATLPVSVAVSHVDRPSLVVVAERGAPKKRASRPHAKRKHRASKRKPKRRTPSRKPSFAH